MELPDLGKAPLAIIGLGYVGLPLALEFSKPQTLEDGKLAYSRRVIGFDINEKRLDQLRKGLDSTNEVLVEEILEANSLEFTSNTDTLAKADVFIITVPTPIDEYKRPDLSPLKKASITVGKALKARVLLGAKSLPVVIYESTVFPGATEEICVPILEKESGLELNNQSYLRGFVCGYSPERINPGDKKHNLRKIIKVTSGSNSLAATWIDNFYRSIIEVGTHLAPSIKVAEAAKVIENTQRDLNIALINELAMIFKRMDIDTTDVLQAAGTKWNFLPFRPGLVGGHCIGVDPYYLTYRSEQLGYRPEVVLSGRRINDGMGKWIVDQAILEMTKLNIDIRDADVLVLGLTFKPNCPDLRNSGALRLVDVLQTYGMNITGVDPIIDIDETNRNCSFPVFSEIPKSKKYTLVIGAVSHLQFTQITVEKWKELLVPRGLFVDIQGMIPKEINAWRI